MFIPGHERYTEMTPEEFENHSLNLLKMEAGKFENSSFEHDVMMKSHDGTYQIDGNIIFRNCQFNVSFFDSDDGNTLLNRNVSCDDVTTIII